MNIEENYWIAIKSIKDLTHSGLNLESIFL